MYQEGFELNACSAFHSPNLSFIQQNHEDNLFGKANFIDKHILRKPLQQHKQHLSRFNRPKEKFKLTLESC